MLNISRNTIKGIVPEKDFTSFQKTGLSSANLMFTRWLVGTFLVILLLFFLPWTQNIQTNGDVTTLQPGQRPQTIHSTIAGRIERWHVREGQLVQKGDTIVHISEIKTEYFDPELVMRTGQQVSAKEGAIVSYGQKVRALENQIGALKSELALKREQLTNKIRQTELKITSDSIELERAIIDNDIANRQFDRNQELYNKGIKALTDVEEKNRKVQETRSKMIAAENKFLTSRNELTNAQIDLNNVRNEYNQKIAKAQSDKFSTLSSRYDAEGSVNKLKIQSSNYEKRSSFYFITAPQDSYITQALKPGIGETVKEGTPIVSIMPEDYELAVELYIKPMDLPLVDIDSEVRFLFDGWPAIIFSGWPDQSFGTYKGRVVAIDNSISSNGRYRILVAADQRKKPWPIALRPGSGAKGIMLLGNVPLWYEIWRQLNGFPPDYYQEDKTKLPKLKAPVKSVK